jgi:hypothetical protein
VPTLTASRWASGWQRQRNELEYRNSSEMDRGSAGHLQSPRATVRSQFATSPRDALPLFFSGHRQHRVVELGQVLAPVNKLSLPRR